MNEKEFILDQVESDYLDIISNDKIHIDIKNKALSYLMTRLEGLYPKSLEDKETEVYKLYIKISNARNFEHSFYNE